MKSFRALAIIIVVLLALVLASWLGSFAFLRSDLFRTWLSKKVSRSLNVDGQFESISWDGSVFRSPGFAATGIPKSRLNSLRAKDISAQVDWWQLLKIQIVIDHLHADQIDLFFGSRVPVHDIDQIPKQRAQIKSWLPTDLQIREISVDDVHLRWETKSGQQGHLIGSSVSAIRKNPDLWYVVVSGGEIQHQEFPAVQIESAHCSFSQELMNINDAKFKDGSSGKLDLLGKIQFVSPRKVQLQANFTGIDSKGIFPADWYFSGILSGQLHYDGSLDRLESGSLDGPITFDNAQVDFAKYFVKLRPLLAIERFTVVKFDSFRTNIHYNNKETLFSDLDASSKGGLRIEGYGSVRRNQINATMQLGIAPFVVSSLAIPITPIFSEQRKGYFWTTVKVNGTLEDPHEDLSPRLLDL
ncbi:MAG: hypothetical protein JO076_03215, partial [Verrucomicrobia bacterium]|nr:hypothetical protein [Verrucomicrobiota bacterium]